VLLLVERSHIIPQVPFVGILNWKIHICFGLHQIFYRVIKSRRQGWAGGVARTGEIGSSGRIL
jgi:hypothetical protein